MPSSLTKKDLSILIANALDHFDTALYGFLAPVLAPIFFPKTDPVVQIILAYSVMATSLVTRPIGTFLFGIIAQKFGSLSGLAYSLIGVSIATVLNGLIPTYDQIGWLAPLSLILIRAFKGIFAAGESTIAKLYILEDKSHTKAFKSSYLYQTSTMLGIVFASGASTVVIASGYEYLWRVCFLFGGVAGFVGYGLRKHLAFKESILLSDFFSLAHNMKVLKSLWLYKAIIAKVAIATSFSSLTYTISFIVMNSFVPLVTSISLTTMMTLNTSLLIFDMLAIPLLGAISCNYQPRKIMLSSCLILALTIVPLWVCLQGASLWYVTFVRFWIVFWGVLFLCPLNLWCKNLLNSADQYLVIGMGSAFAAATVGRLTPVICLSLWYFTGSSLSIALYILAIILVTIYVLKS